MGFYREAAAQGHAEALVHLGVALYVGSGATVDRAATLALALALALTLALALPSPSPQP